MMENVEQHEILNALIGEAQRIRVLDAVDSRIGKEICGDAAANDGLHAADARSDFYSRRIAAGEALRNLAIEVEIDLPEQRLPLQAIVVEEDFVLMTSKHERSR